MKIQNAYTFTNKEINLICSALLSLLLNWTDADGNIIKGKEKDYEKVMNLYQSM